MNNIATIYRFNTPFLDLAWEVYHIVSVIKKVEKSVEFDGISFVKQESGIWDYHKVVLDFDKNLWRVEFFYTNDIETKVYYLPVFKLNIYLNDSFLLNNELKKKAVKFLNNIFECFDWLNEKEYLIDLNNNFYYKNWFFSSKIFPHYDFSDIDKVKRDFEDKHWMVLLENFIKKFQNKSFILTKTNSAEYHKLHWVLLYFIYLVFLMFQNIEKSKLAIEGTDNIDNEIYESQLKLMKNRLAYVNEINTHTFEKYKNRLELFFKMF